MGSLIEFNNSDKIYAILDNIDDFVKEEEEETIILFFLKLIFDEGIYE